MTPKALKQKLNSDGLRAFNGLEADEQDYYCFDYCDNCSELLSDDELNRAVCDSFARVCTPCRPIVQEQLNELMEGMASL